MLWQRIDQQIEVEAKEEEFEELEMEVEEEVDEAILELMKINQISKIEAEAKINNLTNPR